MRTENMFVGRDRNNPEVCNNETAVSCEGSGSFAHYFFSFHLLLLMTCPMLGQWPRIFRQQIWNDIWLFIQFYLSASTLMVSAEPTNVTCRRSGRDVRGTLPYLRWFIQRILPRSFVTFRIKFIFLLWVVPTPNPQAWGPPLVGSPRLLIQYIRNYLPYLEAVSSNRNLRTRHAVVTRDAPNMKFIGTV
jgi:hypothetical protein